MQGKVEGMRVFGSDRNSLKVRRAQSGSYRDELSEEDIKYCNELMRKLPSIYGYSTPIDSPDEEPIKDLE